MSCDALGVAHYYQGLVSHFVIDEQDAELAPGIEALGMRVLCMPTVMRTVDDQSLLAQRLLEELELSD